MSEPFHPYAVRDSAQTVEQVVAQVNEAQWYGYGPDYRAGGIDKVIASPLIDFETFLAQLVAIDHLTFVSHRQLAERPEPEPGVVRVAIRHDIDSDIVSAIAQAEIEQRLGVVATWLVLHTAPYYGEFDEAGTFLRNDAMAPMYRRLQDLGHEVSLHTDPLGVFQFHHVDGAAAVETELAWLRANGIDIVGTTAHNHRRTYGAENFEVFRDYVMPDGRGLGADVDHVDHDGRVAPLRVLDAASLALEYEGNQILWREPAVDYCSARFVNEWAAPWFRQRNADRRSHELRFVDQDRLVEHFRDLAPGQDAVVVIHPEYFGARIAVDQDPIVDPDPTATREPWPEAGWLHHRPWTVIVDKAIDEPRPTVGIAVANEWGMRGLPVADRLALTDPHRRLLVIGADRTAAPEVAVPAAWPERSARLLSQISGERWASFLLADRAMGIDRLWSWLQFGRRETDATTVVIEIPADPDANVGVSRWGSRALSDGAAGTYLVSTPGGIAQRRFSPRLGDASSADHLQYDRSPERDAEANDPGGDASALYRWAVQTLVDDGCDVVIVLAEPADAPAPVWIEDLTTIGPRVRLVGPVSMPANRSALSHHRIVSEHLCAQLLELDSQRLEPRGSVRLEPVGVESTTRTLAAVDAEREPTDLPPEPDALAANQAERDAIGLRPYPAPFESAVSFVSDIDGSTTRYFERYMTEIVGGWGLDHGDSIHLAGYHQRHSVGRGRVRTNTRSVLNYQLRVDNAAIDEAAVEPTPSWLAHVLAAYHRGDIDHLHGLYAWGARSLPLAVDAHPSDPARSQATSSFSRGRNPRRVRRRWPWSAPDEGVPYALNAEYFPIVSFAMRINGSVVPPDRVTARWADAEVELPLRDVRPGPNRTRTAIFTAPVDVLSFVAADDQPTVRAQCDLVGIDIDLRAADIIAAAIHNTDRRGVVAAIEALRDRYRAGFDLITTHGRYHFFAQGKLEAISQRVIDAQQEYWPEPIALYGAPEDADIAAAAISDVEASPAAVQSELIDLGLRFVTPFGYIARGPKPFDVAAVTFPVTDRSGAPLRYLQRCLPEVPEGVADPKSSRLSSFEVRLETILDEIDSRRRAGQDGGVWPFYTHLGQTKDLDEDPDPWFSGTGLSALANRFWGATEGPRPWVTRASVLANYSAVVQRLPALTRRFGDRIEITNTTPAQQSGERPLRAADLFGVSFEVNDAAGAELLLDGEPIGAVDRRTGDGAVTVVACGIRWPILDAADPVELAALGGDIDRAETRGSWSWVDAERRADRHGTLIVGSDGVASLRLSLGDLDVSGAQVASFRARASHDIASISLGLEGERGDRMLIADHHPEPSSDHRFGVIEIDMDRERWSEPHLALWGARSVEPMTPSMPRAIRAVEIVVKGAPGARFDIASLWLGRPKTNDVVPERGVLIGGDATGMAWVDVASLDGSARHRCLVEATGVFVTPVVEPGAWVIDAPGIDRRAIQVATERFDLILRPTRSATRTERPDTTKGHERRWPRWRRR